MRLVCVCEHVFVRAHMLQGQSEYTLFFFMSNVMYLVLISDDHVCVFMTDRHFNTFQSLHTALIKALPTWLLMNMISTFICLFVCMLMNFLVEVRIILTLQMQSMYIGQCP